MKIKSFVVFGIFVIVTTAHFVQAQDSEILPESSVDVVIIEEVLPIAEDPSLDEVNTFEETVIVAEPEINEIVTVDIDAPTTETAPTQEENILTGNPDNGETIITNIDGGETETTPVTEEENPEEIENPLFEEEVLNPEEILPEEEIIPEIPEEPDTEVYLTAEDIQAHMDFVKSLPKISSENIVKDISKQEFSDCTLETPTLEVTESDDSIIDLDISDLENKNSFDLGFTPLGIDIIVETSSFVKDLFKEEQASLVIDTESETQKGIFSIPLLTTDKESKEKSLCQITVISE